MNGRCTIVPYRYVYHESRAGEMHYAYLVILSSSNARMSCTRESLGSPTDSSSTYNSGICYGLPCGSNNTLFFIEVNAS
jgi:hypothetical protein